MIQWATVPVPLGIGGIDTRSDSKTVTPPKLRRLENGTFRTPGAVQKRYGSAALGNLQLRRKHPGGAAAGRDLEDAPISGVKRVFAYGDQLLMETNADVLAYSPALDRWLPVGPAPTLRVDYQLRTSPYQASIAAVDTAVADGLIVTVHNNIVLVPGHEDTVNIQITDQRTGQVLQRRVLSSTNSGRPRAVAIGNTVMVFWVRSVSLLVVSVSRAAIALWNTTGPVSVTVASDLHAAPTQIYDVALSGGRVLVAYSSNAATIKFGYLEPSGVLDGTYSTEAPAANPTSLTCAVEPVTGNFAIAWGMSSLPRVDVRMWNFAKTALWATQTLGGHVVTQMGAVFAPTVGLTATTDLRVFYEQSGPALGVSDHRVHQWIVYTSGAAAAENDEWGRHAGLASRPWVEGGRVYCVLVHESPLQSVYYVQRASNYLPIGDSDTAYGYSTQLDMVIVAALFYGQAAGVALEPTTDIGYQPAGSSAASLGGGKYLWTAIVRDLRDDVQKDIRRMVPVVLDFSQPAEWAESGGAAFAAGGILWRLDADVLVEQGFILSPEGVAATPSNGAGALTSSTTYVYRCYYEWTFPGGEREQSTAIDVSVALGAADDTVTLTIPTLSLTNKRYGAGARGLVSIVVYRRKQGETVAKRVSDTDINTIGVAANGYILNEDAGPGAVNAVTWTDGLSDAAIAGNESDYLSANECENIPPGPSTVITAGNERLLVGGLEDPAEMRPSKLRFFGEAVSFSDALDIAVNAGIGPMTGLASLGLSWVVFRERQIYIINGPGPDNVLDAANEITGGTWESPVVVSDDIGCINARSITRVPAGLVFQSAKGFYLLPRGGGEPLYIGADVEAYNGETVTSAVTVLDSHEVRITLASGVVLVWDYLAVQWATWDLSAASAVMWQDQWVYLADTTGTVRKEVVGRFDDDGLPYALALETPWIDVVGMQGVQRVRRLLFLGEFRGNHKPRVWVAFDWEDAWLGPFDWEAASVVNTEKYGDGNPYGRAPNGAAGTYGGNVVGPSGELLPASTVYQWQVSLPRQKCSAIRVRVEEQPRSGGAYPLREGFRLTEMALEVGRRKGAVHLGSDRRTG